MRRIVLAAISGILLCAVCGLPAFAQLDILSGKSLSKGGAQSATPKVAVTGRILRPIGSEPAKLRITARMAPSWHIYSTSQVAGGPLKTRLKLTESPDYRLVGDFVALPPAQKHSYDIWPGIPVEEHAGQVTWTAPIELRSGVDLSKVEIAGSVNAQVCAAETCLPRQDYDFVATVANEPEPATVAAAEENEVSDSAVADYGSLPLMIGLSLLGGLILNLMPCVLPVIGLKVLSFVEQAGHNRGRVLMLNLWYTLGLLLVFWVLATLAVTLKLGWGQQFSSTPFNVAMAALVFVMALSFLGIWEIPIPGFVGAGTAVQVASREDAFGALAKGALTTLLATPCSGPFLGSVFGYTLKQPPQVTYLIFTSIGLGMASPYLLIGAFPSLLRFLPRPGAWMETFKQMMGFVLLGTVVFVFTFLDKDYLVPTFALLVGLWAACWWIGRVPFTLPTSRRMLAWLEGAAFAAVVGSLAFSWLGPRESLIAWKPFSRTSLDQLTSEGKTVLVDFTADWCLTCKLNLARAINTQEVRDVVETNGVVPLLADWTKGSPEIKQMLASLDSKSIPLLAIFPAGRPGAPILLRDTVSKSEVLDALKKAGPSRRGEVAQHRSSEGALLPAGNRPRR